MVRRRSTVRFRKGARAVPGSIGWLSVAGQLVRAQAHRRGSSAWQSKRLIIAVSPVQIRPSLQAGRHLGSRYIQIDDVKGTTVAATDVRPKITLACQECKHRNYITKKNRRNDPDRLDMKKFCPNCGKHTEHRETR